MIISKIIKFKKAKIKNIKTDSITESIINYQNINNSDNNEKKTNNLLIVFNVMLT